MIKLSELWTFDMSTVDRQTNEYTESLLSFSLFHLICSGKYENVD